MMFGVAFPAAARFVRFPVAIGETYTSSVKGAWAIEGPGVKALAMAIDAALQKPTGAHPVGDVVPTPKFETTLIVPGEEAVSSTPAIWRRSGIVLLSGPRARVPAGI